MYQPEDKTRSQGITDIYHVGEVSEAEYLTCPTYIQKWRNFGRTYMNDVNK